MTWPRLSIRSIMALLVAIAVDFALLRLPSEESNSALMLAMLGTTIMANVLAFAGYRIVSRRGHSGPFLDGFFLGGIISVVLFLWTIWYFPEGWKDWFMLFAMRSSTWFYEHFPHSAFNSLGDAGADAIFSLVYRIFLYVFFALPQLGTALVVGTAWRFLKPRLIRSPDRERQGPA